MTERLLLIGLVILVSPAHSCAQAQTQSDRPKPEPVSQVQEEARNACQRRQQCLLRLDELRWQQEVAANKRNSSDRTIRRCEELRDRLRHGQQVAYALDGSEVVRRPSTVEVAEAITAALWTEPLDPAERTRFIRDMVRGHLFQSRALDQVLQTQQAALTDRRNMAQAEVQQLDSQIEKLNLQIAQLEPVIKDDNHSAEMLIEATIFHGPAFLHPLYAEAQELRRGQPATQPAAVATSGLRVYRGHFVPDPAQQVRLTSPPEPQTLTVDPEKGTAVFANSLSYTGMGSMGSPGAAKRTQLHSTVQVSFNPGRVDASGVVEGTYDAAVEITVVGASRPPSKLRIQAVWQAVPVPGKDGRIYEVYFLDLKKETRNLAYRLELVEK